MAGLSRQDLEDSDALRSLTLWCVSLVREAKAYNGGGEGGKGPVGTSWRMKIKNRTDYVL